MSFDHPNPPDDLRDSRQSRRLYAQRLAISLVVALVAIFGILSYVAHRSSPPPSRHEAAVNTSPSPTAADINQQSSGTGAIISRDIFVAAPETHVGDTVNMQGRVTRILSNHAFVIKATGTADEQEFLVLMPRLEGTVGRDNPRVGIGSEVSFQAAIMGFDPMQAQSMTSDVDPGMLQDYKGKIMLVSRTAPLAH